MKNTAVILAAGLGARLGSLTATRPKALLEVSGRSLLAHSVTALIAGGVTDVLVITGFAHEQIEAALDECRGLHAVRAVQAQDYVRGGSMGSLLRATAEVSGPILLLESDLLYDGAFIAAARDCTHSTILTTDPSGSGDEVYVVAGADGHLSVLGKRLPPDLARAAVGELAGISYLSSDTLAAYRTLAGAWRASGRVDAHYEEVLLALAEAGHPIAVKHCAGLAWTEVDTAADLARARNVIWPRIAAGRRGP